MDAYGEVGRRRGARQGVEHGFRHARSELFGGEAVAPADHPRQGREVRRAAVPRFGNRRDDVEVKRFADGARLFRPVENGDSLDGRRQRLDKRFDGERPIEVDGQDANLATFTLAKGLCRRCGGRGATAHRDDHVGGVWRSLIGEGVVATSRQLGEAIHGVFDDARRGEVIRVARLARLEEDIRVLRGTG